MAKKSKSDRLASQLRKLIDVSGVSRQKICKAALIDKGNFSRFMAGSSGLSLSAINRLAEFLDLDIVSRKEQ